MSAHNLLSLLIWVLCFLGFTVGGVIGAFFPHIVQRSAINSKPKWKFIPKPEEMWPARSMGGRKYFESRSYRLQLRVIGFASLVAAALMMIILFKRI